MTSEYMNNLYRDLLSNSPQTVTIPIPSDMGTGQIAQVVTKQGAVVSDWKMNYFSDMNVRGINSEDYIQMLFCLNDGEMCIRDRAMTAHFISSPSPSVKRTGTGAILPTTGLGPTPCPSPPILTHGVLTATAIWPSTAIPVWSNCFSARPAKPTHRNGRKPLSGIS